ncbi:MAG: DNA replication/repair protein RecF [Actinomycetaceae bacterium]|nr:DNA replication/repair protein RecF [Actinomycetaceae bacterium]
MYLSHLALNDFRSYEHAVIEFDKGVTTFIGSNGNGKTNIVEAIGYLSTLSSHRVSTDTALVRQGTQAAVVQARLMHKDHPTTLEVEIYAGRANRARINRSQTKPSQLLGIVKSVVFAPEDLSLVRDEPAVRRRFLDDLMIQQRPRMAKVKADYDKVLKQRGALLKTLSSKRWRGMAIDEGALEVWNIQLAELGGQIMAERARIISTLRPAIAHYYEKVAGGDKTARIDYKVSADKDMWTMPSAYDIYNSQTAASDIESHEEELSDPSNNTKCLMHALERQQAKEIERGANLVGPHRDDLVLSLATFPTKGYASHGETWSFVLALRLAGWKILKEDDEQPILILDDVFAELDATRRDRLAEIAGDIEQVFITAAVDEDVPMRLGGRHYRVAPGVVQSGVVNNG